MNSKSSIVNSEPAALTIHYLRFTTQRCSPLGSASLDSAQPRQPRDAFLLPIPCGLQPLVAALNQLRQPFSIRIALTLYLNEPPQSHQSSSSNERFQIQRCASVSPTVPGPETATPNLANTRTRFLSR